jgi:hypothetical protein
VAVFPSFRRLQGEADMDTDYAFKEEKKQRANSQDLSATQNRRLQTWLQAREAESQFRDFALGRSQQVLRESEEEKSKAAKKTREKPERSAQEKEAAHIFHAFRKKHAVDVLPHKQDAIGISPALVAEVNAFLDGKTPSLSHTPADAFRSNRLFVNSEDRKNMSRKEFVRGIEGKIAYLKKADILSMLEGQRMAENQGSLPSSFVTLFHALEQARIHEQSPQTRAEHKAMVLQELGESVSRTKEMPLTQQLKVALMYFWASDGREFPGYIDERVKQALEKMKAPMQVLLLEKENAHYAHILWPIFQDLETQSLEELQIGLFAKNLCTEHTCTIHESVPEAKSEKEKSFFQTFAHQVTSLLQYFSKEVQTPKASLDFHEDLRRALEQQLHTKDLATLPQEKILQVKLDALPPHVSKELLQRLRQLDEKPCDSLKNQARELLDNIQVGYLREELPGFFEVRKHESKNHFVVALRTPPDLLEQESRLKSMITLEQELLAEGDEQQVAQETMVVEVDELQQVSSLPFSKRRRGLRRLGSSHRRAKEQEEQKRKQDLLVDEIELKMQKNAREKQALFYYLATGQRYAPS